MTLLTRAAILAISDLRTQDVDVPDWGGTVRIRTLTAGERDDFDASLSTGTGATRTLDLHNIRARLLALCIIDDAGNPIFTHDDVLALGGKSSAAVGVVFDAAQKLNGMLPAAVEVAAKN